MKTPVNLDALRREFLQALGRNAYNQSKVNPRDDEIVIGRAVDAFDEAINACTAESDLAYRERLAGHAKHLDVDTLGRLLGVPRRTGEG